MVSGCWLYCWYIQLDLYRESNSGLDNQQQDWLSQSLNVFEIKANCLNLNTNILAALTTAWRCCNNFAHGCQAVGFLPLWPFRFTLERSAE